MQDIRSIAVFCGSNFGNAPHYARSAEALGHAIGRRGMRLVYGGTNKGLMGVTASAVLAAGGEVLGVITDRLHQRGHLHPHLSAHEVVPGLRERKARMSELADAFVALPGGYGTLEELLEVATLAQLGEQKKAFGVVNVDHFYDPLIAMLAAASAAGFMKHEHRDMMLSDADPERLIDALHEWRAPTVTKWIGQPEA